jgi:arginyl-tRNA synthetase
MIGFMMVLIKHTVYWVCLLIKNYYESETYLLGKNIMEEGLKKGVLYEREDSSVWINLDNEGLDEKTSIKI